VTPAIGRYETRETAAEWHARGWGVPKDATIDSPAAASTAAQGHASDVVLPRVAILLGTKDGAAFLGDQLQSFTDQSHKNWFLVVSDDESRDATREMIERFAAAQPQRVVVRDGPKQGVTANFLSLATDPTIEADFFAFSDQDDVWHPDKLARALACLATAPEGAPALYCGRTELMTEDGRCYGLSPLFRRPPSFRNALVQSLGGGNTMVFNRAAKKLVEAAGAQTVVLHDWWLYQLLSAAGGAVFYDPRPMLRYRQHPDNLIGSNLGVRARLVRIRLMLGGRFRDWNETNLAALRRLPAHLITPDNRRILDLFAAARSGPLPMRLVHLRRSGVHRQSLLDNLGLMVAALIRQM
jgi:glycosyltransferase involved in cell wall biosynthesis